jgi:DNA-binding IclR family transcriptional regulator
MPKTTPSSTEPASPASQRAAALRAAAAHNYTAERALRALEVIALNPSSVSVVATALAVHPRTARRILRTLTKQQYVEQSPRRGRAAQKYQPTVRLLAMAAQLAPQLPLVQRGRRTVREIEQQTDLTAYLAVPSYLAVPCYGDVLVIACSGEHTVRPWATLPAATDAAGHILLAHRAAWRQSLASAEPKLAVDEPEAAQIIERGHVLAATSDERSGSLAVVVPDRAEPLAALAIRGSGVDLLAREEALAELLQRAAAELAEATRPTDDA